MGITYKIERREAMYGSHWYPVCQRAKTLASLAGNKTMTPDTISRLAEVGIRPTDVTPSHLDLLLSEEGK